MNKNILLICILGLFLLLNMQNILSLGITPGRTTVNFEPGLHKEVSFSIINSGHEDMSLVFMVRGNLSEYITLNQTKAEFKAGEESKSFSYTIDLPERIETPGRYDIEIIAMEVPKESEEVGANIGTALAVVTQLYIYVPYPNKYIEGAVDVVESNGELIFLIPVISYGKLDIVNIRAKIDIYSGTEEKITSLVSNSDSLLSLERKELSAKWKPDVNPGRYKAVITLIYDENVETILKEFNIGEMFLDIKELTVKDFQLGEIAKFSALVENKWSSDLKDAYLNIIVYNNEGEVMADFKSPTYDINSLSQTEMISYWDTGGVHVGTYDGKLILKYGEKTTEKNIQLKITNDKIEIIGITGNVVVKGSKFNLTNILLIGVGVLIIMNIIWFVIIRKFLRKKS